MRYVFQDLFVIQILVYISYDSLCRAVQVRYTIPPWNMLWCVRLCSCSFPQYVCTSECNHPQIYDEAKTKKWMLRDGISPFEKKKKTHTTSFGCVFLLILLLWQCKIFLVTLVCARWHWYNIIQTRKSLHYPSVNLAALLLQLNFF